MQLALLSAYALATTSLPCQVTPVSPRQGIPCTPAMAASAPKLVAAVFGAGGGLGWGISHAFATAGYHVVMARRNEAALKELIAAKTGSGASLSPDSFSTLPCDVTDEESVATAISTMKLRVCLSMPCVLSMLTRALMPRRDQACQMSWC